MLATDLFKFICFTLVRVSCRLGQVTWWLINGTWRGIQQSKLPKNYHRSTQLLNVWFKYRFDKILSPTSLSEFLTTHGGFVHPEKVIQDNITLYSLSPSQAVFIQSDKDVNVFDSNVAAFAKEGQHRVAKALYVMPIESFHKLADKVGGPHAPLILLGNTTRCGSTLLAQMLDKTDQIACISEPAAFDAIAMACQNQQMTRQQLDRYITSGIRLICKPVDRKISAYFIKIVATSMTHMADIREVFPDTKLLFMYREGLDVAVSMASTAYVAPMWSALLILGRIHKAVARTMVEQMGLPGKYVNFRIKNDVLTGVMVWVLLCKKYLTLRSENLPICAIKYEDLIEDPEYTLEQMFSYCDLPRFEMKKALRGMEHDSQRSSVFSKANISKKSPKLKLPNHLLPEARAFCEQHGIPSVPDPCVLEGTISHRTP